MWKAPQTWWSLRYANWNKTLLRSERSLWIESVPFLNPIQLTEFASRQRTLTVGGKNRCTSGLQFDWFGVNHIIAYKYQDMFLFDGTQLETIRTRILPPTRFGLGPAPSLGIFDLTDSKQKNWKLKLKLFDKTFWCCFLSKNWPN